MKSSALSFPLGLIIALIAFPQISETIYTPAIPSIAEGLSTSAANIEATLTTYFLGFAFGVSVWGAISDRIGRRVTMLIGLFIYGLATFACGSSLSVGQLLALRGIQAFGASVGSVITQTMLRDVCTPEQRAKSFALISGALAFSPAIGPAVGGLLSQYWGWRSNFWGLLLLAVFLIAWSFLRLPETRPEGRVSPSVGTVARLGGQMLRSRTLWGHVLAIGATNGILFSFYAEAPFVLVELAGLTPSQYGLVGLVIASATLVASRISYLWVSQKAPEATMQIGSTLSLAGAGSFLLANLLVPFGTSFASSLIHIASLFTLFVGIGLVIPNSLSVALRPFQANVGTAGSLFGGLYYLLIAMATFGMSLVHNGSHLALPLYLLCLSGLLILGVGMASRAEVTDQTNEAVPEAR